jgi:acid phosphatase type 7
VGTGGVGTSAFGTIQPNSLVRGSPIGVMRLTLKASSYDFRFVPIAGQTFSDAGSGSCH